MPLRRAITVAPTESGGLNPSSSLNPSQLSSFASRVSSEQATATDTSKFIYGPSDDLPSPTATPASSTSGKDALTKSVVAFVFVALAVVFLGAFIIRTWIHCRRNNITLSQYFSSCFSRRRSTNTTSSSSHRSATSRPAEVPRTTGLPPVSQAHPHAYPLQLPDLYPDRRRARRTNAADTDRDGRRLGPGEDKEAYELPAYDGGKGGPPKYLDVAGMRRGPGQGEGGDVFADSGTDLRRSPSLSGEVATPDYTSLLHDRDREPRS